jgi:hypothetical protein
MASSGKGPILVTGAIGTSGRSFLYFATRWFIREHRPLWRRIVAIVSQNTEKSVMYELDREFGGDVDICAVDMRGESFNGNGAKVQHIEEFKEKYQRRNIGNVKTLRKVLNVPDPVEFIYIVPSFSPRRVDHVQTIINAAKAIGSVKFIVLISIVGADKRIRPWAADFHQMELIVYVYQYIRTYKYTYIYIYIYI